MLDAISVSQLSFLYPGSEKKALDGLDLNIKKGEAFGLLGPNGAGKTTLLSCICRQISGFQGQIKIFNQDVTQIGDGIIKVGFAPQELAVYPSLSIEDNLDFFASLSTLKSKEVKERVNWALEFTELHERRYHKVTTLSGGMKRRLNLAIAILNKPEVLILDEPTVGVDPLTRNHIFEKVEQLKKQGITLIYTTHYMEEVERLCQQIAVIDQGKLLFKGSLQELKIKEGYGRLEQCYLSLTGGELEAT